jgi:hypothetical protein
VLRVREAVDLEPLVVHEHRSAPLRLADLRVKHDDEVLVLATRVLRQHGDLVRVLAVNRTAGRLASGAIV